MKFKPMVFWLTVLLIYLMAAKVSVDSDTWWHLRAGKWMIEQRQILTVDLFSYTRYGAEWRYPGWLIEIPMYLIESIFGLGGLSIFSALIITVSFTLIYLSTHGNELVRAFVTILATIVSSIYWSARPHLMTILFAALFLYWLENGARNGYVQWRKSIWFGLPLLMLCWVNMHGGFIAGFLIWGIFLAELTLKLTLRALAEHRNLWRALSHPGMYSLLFAGLAMGLLATLNPLGIKIFLYPFQTVSIEKLGLYIQEWQSPDFHSLSLQPFIWLLLVLVAVSAFVPKRWELRDYLLVATFLYLALMAVRNVALFALVATLPILRLLQGVDFRTVLPKLLSELSLWRANQSSIEHPKINLFVLGLVFVGCVVRTAMVYPEEAILKELADVTPAGAVHYLKETQPQGRLFNSYNWGGYLLWMLPEIPVFVDGRTDLYNDEILDQWFQVVKFQDGWEKVIERWQINVILMEKDWIGAKFLQQSEWCQKYLDDVAIVLEKCP